MVVVLQTFKVGPGGSMLARTLVWLHPVWKGAKLTRQLVALQRDGAFWLAKNNHYNTPGMHFWAIFTQKKSHNSVVENYHIGHNLHLY